MPWFSSAIVTEQEARTGTQPSAPGDAFAPNALWWEPAGINVRIGHGSDVEVSGVQPARNARGQICIAVEANVAMLKAFYEDRWRFFSVDYFVEREVFRPLHFNDDKRNVIERARLEWCSMTRAPLFRGTRIVVTDSAPSG